ncbi:hypothetical protein DICSQDRAFT_136417 [Dichomitus squalens LYAD-421 SS1]|uniref:Uncharacterized protein n=1 Tax=Dichomitus squalens (strain LYAD-421) TaxID=732165 RepID=R7SZY4_DICSQ|nr:uncharacterized protein DICSQDRAFT_136417 [Dichomitus squalens LYAD-421 SS1]EJF61528.1 hypothetical protein DICSQDRAFT_136417 [Dichomitus squalens LYAD-421 SS1]
MRNAARPRANRKRIALVRSGIRCDLRGLKGAQCGLRRQGGEASAQHQQMVKCRSIGRFSTWERTSFRGTDH